ncbi:MAG TPA: hypothetical protein VJR90_08840 [Gammaproteobacteria bacterium]|nr:hypothetical protein [Gammaproteobacteria bacterium]
MTWLDYHAASEKLASEAQSAQLERNIKRARELYRAAAQAERRALDEVDVSKARTRGVTAVSAVALWFKAFEFVEAERLAYSLLADPDIPNFARGELRTLVQAIWTEASKQEANVDFVPGQVLVSVKGGEVITGGAPLDLIVDKVQTIQSMFYRTIEFLNGAAHRRTGRPTKEIQEACRPWLFQSAPGSYQFAVAIQKPLQSDFFRENVQPEQIARHFLDIVDASSQQDTTELKRLVGDDSYRSTFLKLARNLAPTGRSFERIELKIPGDPHRVSLGADSRGNINQQLHQMVEPQVSSSEELTELHGILRAVHLDKDWIEIHVESGFIHVDNLRDAVDDVIGPMVNRSVVIQAVHTASNKYKFVDIELAD